MIASLIVLIVPLLSGSEKCVTAITDSGKAVSCAFINDRTGAREIMVRYLDGELHGKQERWHASGKLKHEVNYRNGVVVDPSRGYFENGRLSELETCDHSRDSCVLTTYLIDGRIQKSEISYRGDVIIDTSRSYYETGELGELTICDHANDSCYWTWHLIDGRIWKSGISYRNNTITDTTRSYYETGELSGLKICDHPGDSCISMMYFTEGGIRGEEKTRGSSIVGRSWSRYADGKWRQISEYDEYGKPHGLHANWDSLGRPIDSVIYIHNEILRARSWYPNTSQLQYLWNYDSFCVVEHLPNPRVREAALFGSDGKSWGKVFGGNGILRIYSDGKLLDVWRYNGGERAGSTTYHSDGSISGQEIFSGSRYLTRNWIKYANGKWRQISEYDEKGNRHDLYAHWDSLGRPIDSVIYLHDRILRGWWWYPNTSQLHKHWSFDSGDFAAHKETPRVLEAAIFGSDGKSHGTVADGNGELRFHFKGKRDGTETYKDGLLVKSTRRYLDDGTMNPQSKKKGTR